MFATASDPDLPDRLLFEQYTAGRTKELVTCQAGIRIFPQHIYPDAEIYDVLLVPGGQGVANARKDLRLMNWLARAARLAKVIGAVDSVILLL